MAHHVYTTPGFVIDSRPNGEAGKLLYIFTRDLGLVLATAQSVRLGASKLRYHTQDFSYALYSLVRGKEMWRLTGATAIDDVPLGTLLDATHFLRARVFALLRRLLHGEEANEVLFEILVAFEIYIVTVDIPVEDIEFIECIIVLRVLYALGYVEHGSKGNSELTVFLTATSDAKNWSSELIEKIKPLRQLAVRAINDGLKASQL